MLSHVGLFDTVHTCMAVVEAWLWTVGLHEVCRELVCKRADPLVCSLLGEDGCYNWLCAAGTRHCRCAGNCRGGPVVRGRKPGATGGLPVASLLQVQGHAHVFTWERAGSRELCQGDEGATLLEEQT